MKTPRALLLYDDDNDCELLRSTMSDEGWEVEEAPLGPEAIKPAAGYGLVLFDVQRLSPQAWELIQAWRDTAPDTLLLVAGGRTTQANRVALLETGVAAYVNKPMGLPELRARMRAALRRSQSHDPRRRTFTFGSLTIDLDARTVRSSGHESRLTPSECVILEQLTLHPNQTVPSSVLVKTLWGADPQKGAHSLRLFIQRLRKKLEPDPAHPCYLVTDPAMGYRFQVPEEVSSNNYLDH
jgi:two-component system, OmpR family, KDP operon response regulator KdpE